MAAFASHHVRLALFPLRLDTDRTGYVDIPHSLGRQKLLLMEDVNAIRATNNAIFDDIFWVHLAYVTADDGIERLRDSPASGAPLRARPRRLRGDRPRTPCPGGPDGVRGGSPGGRGSDLGGQRPAPRARAARPGATQLRSPLVRVRPARLDRLGHELRGAGSAARGCVLHLVLPLSLTRGIPHGLRAQSVAEDHSFRGPLAVAPDERRPPLPEIRCRHALVDASLRRIFDEARDYASTPCVLPRLSQTESPRRTPSHWVPLASVRAAPLQAVLSASPPLVF